MAEPPGTDPTSVPLGNVVLLPDAGPLITLAYADSLDLLFAPGWPVRLVDMVWHEVTRHATPTRQKLIDWASRHAVPMLATRTFQRHEAQSALASSGRANSNLGEWAIQEVMTDFALAPEPAVGVFLFEDHRIARANFLLPPACQKVSTRAFLIFLEQQGLIESASDVTAAALRAGRAFSQMRFPAG